MATCILVHEHMTVRMGAWGSATSCVYVIAALFPTNAQRVSVYAAACHSLVIYAEIAQRYAKTIHSIYGPDDTVYAKSESGWINSELFLTWMRKIVFQYRGYQCPVLLFVEGQASHVSLGVIHPLTVGCVGFKVHKVTLW